MKRPLSCLATVFATLVTLLALAGPGIAQEAYRIRSGDVLRIEVLEDTTLNRSVLVSPDGRINLPLAGSVQAGGNTVEAVQNALTAQLAPNFAAAPSVFVSIEQLAERTPAGPSVAAAAPVINIYVLGEVENPGKIEVSPGTTVLQLFAEVGGFAPFAATGRIQLRRVNASGTEQIYALNYDAIEAGTSPNGRTTLLEGDVIVVPQRRLFE